MDRYRLAPWLAWLLVAATLSFPVSATADASSPDALPPETARLLVEIGQDLDTLREEMGRPVTPLPKLAFRGASDYELYQLALALRERANDLYFEWTREALPAASQVDDTPVPKDIDDALNATLHLLGEVGGAIGVTFPAPPATAEPVGRDQALKTLFVLNRQMNAVMQDEVGPGDVFGKVSLGVKYASDLLGRYPLVRRIPPEEPLERRRTPTDVYNRLAGLLTLAGQAFAQGGGRPVEIVERDFAGISVMPGDVYDLAALLIGALDRLAHQGARDGHSYSLSYAGPRLPAHVFRRVGLLEAQLRLLLRQAEANPAPLRAHRHE